MDRGNAPPAALAGRRVAVVGMGSQGSAWAANLADSGVDVTVVLRPGSAREAAAHAAGLAVRPPGDARTLCDVFCILAPDETHAGIVTRDLAGLARGSALVFAHGYSVHHGLFPLPGGVDVVLVAPKGVGPAVRESYVAGGGVAALTGVAQDATGAAWDLAGAIAQALGCGRAGVYRSSFREETQADLFSEQAILCGGVPALVRAGFDVLVSRGYAPEVAYFECLHELKLITDLLAAGGMSGMLDRISTTARFGAAWAGERIVDRELVGRLHRLLDDVESGRFAAALAAEAAAGMPRVAAARRSWDESELERVGRSVRAAASRGAVR
jgi:ketol-acid reductoisomerase